MHEVKGTCDTCEQSIYRNAFYHQSKITSLWIRSSEIHVYINICMYNERMAEHKMSEYKRVNKGTRIVFIQK